MKVTNTYLAFLLAVTVGLATALPKPLTSEECEWVKPEICAKGTFWDIFNVKPPSDPLNNKSIGKRDEEQSCLVDESSGTDVSKRRSRPLKFNPDAQYQSSTCVVQSQEDDPTCPRPSERQVISASFIVNDKSEKKGGQECPAPPEAEVDDSFIAGDDILIYSRYNPPPHGFQPPHSHQLPAPVPRPELVEINVGGVQKRSAEPEAKRLPEHIVRSKHQSIAEHSPELFGLSGMAEFHHVWDNDLPYPNAPVKPVLPLPAAEAGDAPPVIDETEAAGAGKVIEKRAGTTDHRLTSPPASLSSSEMREPSFYMNYGGRSRAETEKERDMADFAHDRQVLGGQVVGWRKEEEEVELHEQVIAGPEEPPAPCDCPDCTEMTEKQRDKYEMKFGRGGLFDMRKSEIVSPKKTQQKEKDAKQ